MFPEKRALEIKQFRNIGIGPYIATCYHIHMASRKVSTTVYLTEEQVAALKELHNRSKVPIAEYIRMGIDMILQKNSEQLPGQISLFEGFEDRSHGVGKKTESKE